DLTAIVDPDPVKRARVIEQVGLEQDPAKLPALQAQLQREQNAAIKRTIEQSIALIQLKSDDPATQIAGCKKLGELGSIPAQDALKTLANESKDRPEVVAAANNAQDAIARHLKMVNTAGTVFRGISTGSVLLVVAIGLAITFGLMGVINMAHGEL